MSTARRHCNMRIPRAFMLICMMSVAATALADASKSAEKLSIAAVGSTHYIIVIKAGAAPAVRHAAAELSKYLEQATDATFNIGHSAADGRHAIHLETITAETGKNSHQVVLGENGYRIKSDAAGNIHIAGGTPRGVLYGVYRFLEKYVGIHWYSSQFESVPHRPDLSLLAIDQISKPRFEYREVFSRDADDADFSARQRLDGQFGHRIGRKLGPRQGGYVAIRGLNIAQLVPRSEYAKSHPEYFAGGQRRFADPAVQRVAARRAVTQLKKWQDTPPRYLLISHADRDSYFSGGEDGRMIQKYKSSGAAFFDFVKTIAKAAKKVSPHTTVLAAGYLWSQKPPVGMTLPDNMGVMLSDIDLNFSRPMDTAGNRHFLRALDGWNKVTQHIIIWDYIADFNSYIQPFPNLDVLGLNIKLLARRSYVEGVFEEGSYGTRGADLAELKAWVLARLLWNPKLKASSLIHQFVAGYYGDAAAYIERYIDLMQRSIHRHDIRLTIKTPPTADYLANPVLQQAEDLFDQAKAAVHGQPVFLKHVKTARIPIDYAALLRGHGPNLKPRARDARFARFKEAVKAAGVTQYREGGSMQSLLAALEIPRVAPKPPAQCQQIADDCRVIEEFGFHLAGDARVVSDSKASDDAAASMRGSTAVWGIQLPLKELLAQANGTWRVVVRARVEPGRDNGKAKPAALRAGVYPGKHRTLRLSEMSDGQYHDITLPGTFRSNTGGSVWIAPPNSRAVKAIYVDRIVAVRYPR